MPHLASTQLPSQRSENFSFFFNEMKYFCIQRKYIFFFFVYSRLWKVLVIASGLESLISFLENIILILEKKKWKKKLLLRLLVCACVAYDCVRRIRKKRDVKRSHIRTTVRLSFSYQLFFSFRFGRRTCLATNERPSQTDVFFFFLCQILSFLRSKFGFLGRNLVV